MTPNDLTPVTLMLEMRERLVRIETKQDNAAEKVEDVVKTQENHEARIVALETEQANQKARVALLMGLGGAAVTVASIFGDKLLSLF
ncbi:hypothetical protein H5V43_06865 [Sphingobium fuliginis]|jgi:uncharacterized membrane protein|uniref:Uncharacterized protein n=1 Tax=Sphingobium fuliginis (strain ATCC 27551) TaxID=336203 RepID=A0A7M2GKQ2_SPHSA|nr:hypothetical protein [Sphingobium fuliginis]QOT72827.1 hypothetical protein H5V43_06865 [Sphingobium fuliginis]